MAIQINGTSGISGVDGSAATPALQGTDSNTGISFGTDTVSINTGGTARATVDSSGNFGIGTTSPDNKLHIFAADSSGSSHASAQLTIENSGNSALQFLAGTSSSSEIRFGDSGDNGAGSIAYVHSDNSLRFGTNNGTEKARIDSSGRLLVGTTSARSGFFNGAGGTDGRLLVETTSSINAFCSVYGAANDGGSYLVLAKHRSGSIGGLTAPNGNSEIGGISFQGADGTDFVEAARIQAFADGTPGANDMPGRLVFSTTADGASSPTERMRISNDGETRIPSVYSFTTAAGANVVVMNSLGALYRSTSSAKYKTSIENLEDKYADALLACRPVWYKSTATADNADWGYWGFIAEEIAEIDPRLVFWKTKEITYDEKGSAVEIPCEPEPEGVQYDRFVPHLLNLIKRQKEQIESQGAAIAALEARLTTLEGGTN